MADIFVERVFDSPLRADQLEGPRMARASRLAALDVIWRESLLDRNGRRMLCRFAAPDEATVCDALRQEAVRVEALWSGSIYTPAAPSSSAPPAAGSARVLVQHRVEEPVTFADLRTVENLCAWCLETHRIALVRMLLSVDFKRIVYLYRAPDAESVRLAHRQAGLGLDLVWPYTEVAGCLPAGRAG